MAMHIPYQVHHRWLRLPQQLLRAEALESIGRRTEALAHAGLFSFYGRSEPLFFARSALLRGRIFESRGERQRALEQYRRYFALYDGCDPELRPELAAVNASLARLEPPPPVR